MKKVSRIEYCASFEPLQSGMEQDEGSRILLPTMKPLDPDKKAEKAISVPAAAPVQEKIDFSNVKIEPIFKDMVDFDTFSKSDFRAVKILACEAVKKSKKLLKFTLNDGERTDRVILSGIHEYYEPEELVGKTAIAIVNLPPRKMMGIDSEGMLISAVHEEVGCNSVLNPGTVIGPDSNVYPTSCVRGVIPASHVYKDKDHIIAKK